MQLIKEARLSRLDIFIKHNVPVLKFTETLKNDKNYVWQIVTTSTTLLLKTYFKHASYNKK